MTKTIRLATQADNNDLLSLTGETMPGMMSISQDYSPNFFDATHIHGDNVFTVVCDNEGELMLKGTIASSVGFLNGEKKKIGYLGGLHTSDKYRGTIFLPKSFVKLNQIRDRSVPFYFTTIVSANENAQTLLEKKRSFMPTYDYVADLSIFVMKAKTAKHSPSVRQASEGDLDELVAFYNSHAPSRNGFYDVGSSLERNELFDLIPADFLVYDDGKIRGALAQWNQQETRRLHVNSYSVPGNILRHSWNATLGMAKWPTFPKPNEALDISYGSFMLAQDDNQDITSALINSAIASSPSEYILFGSTNTDRNLALLQSYRTYEYKSKVYAVTFEDDKVTFDNRPIHLEVGML